MNMEKWGTLPTEQDPVWPIPYRQHVPTSWTRMDSTGCSHSTGAESYRSFALEVYTSLSFSYLFQFAKKQTNKKPRTKQTKTHKYQIIPRFPESSRSQTTTAHLGHSHPGTWPTRNHIYLKVNKFWGRVCVCVCECVKTRQTPKENLKGLGSLRTGSEPLSVLPGKCQHKAWGFNTTPSSPLKSAHSLKAGFLFIRYHGIFQLN